jgi:putative transposase
MMQRQPAHVLIDRVRIDCFVSSESAGTKILIKRPWLTVAIDVYSRTILSAKLTS